MNILLTNDDGIHAPGLWILEKALRADHQVMVVAPDRERSAVGHGITLNQPLRVHQDRTNGFGPGYSVTGTPADCVRLGIRELCARKPDMVISGVNPGSNVGVNIHYSGTVSAAKEAALHKVSAIAVSVESDLEDLMQGAADFVARLILTHAPWPLPVHTVLNVNYPDTNGSRIRGVRVCRQNVDLAPEAFEKRVDPRNGPYYWYGAAPGGDGQPPDFDQGALTRKYITLTPVTCDVTDHRALDALRQWGFETPGSMPGSADE